MLRKTHGFSCSQSGCCAHVSASTISSSVPEAAGKGEAGVRQRLHLVLPFVHGVDHVQVGQSLVGELLVRELPRNHAGDAAALLEHRAGQDAHQPDAGAPVHESDTLGRHQPAQGLGFVDNPLVGSEVAAQVDADVLRVGLLTPGIRIRSFAARHPSGFLFALGHEHELGVRVDSELRDILAELLDLTRHADAHRPFQHQPRQPRRQERERADGDHAE